MNKLYTYMTIACTALLAACATDDIDNNNADANTDVYITPEDAQGVCATVQEPYATGDEQTRSTLVYDYTQNKMIFSWDYNEKTGAESNCTMGIFPISIYNEESKEQDEVGAAKSSQLEYAMYESRGEYSGVFESTDKDNVNPKVLGNKNSYYVAVKPYIKNKDKDYTNIQFNFDGQVAQYSPQYYYYPNFNKDKDATTLETYKQLYQESEKRACANLGDYDYMVSSKAMSNAGGSCAFTLYRIGAITRLYFKLTTTAPTSGFNSLVVDSIQLYVNGPNWFPIKLKLNAKDAIDLTDKTGTGEGRVKVSNITPVTKSRVLSLKYGHYDANGEYQHDGLSLKQTEEKDGEGNYNHDYYLYNGNCYFAAYFIVPPIDLTVDGETVNIFVYAHNTTNNNQKLVLGNKNALTTPYPNLKPNAFHKWNSTNNLEPEPIELKAITVQEWQEITGYSNSDSGKGTETW